MSKDTRKQAQKEIEEVLRKHKLVLKYKLDFPVYKILPNEVKLALSIIERHGMNIAISFEDKK